ncbi:MYND-type domain-containing protein [Favolaschia claudopus]|uniref:MYND-type domain-containing protein n=1 Tax=Favolaschia claudopus TaxID=2862362 RepID=A0AAW0C0S7_9AGAR
MSQIAPPATSGPEFDISASELKKKIPVLKGNADGLITDESAQSVLEKCEPALLPNKMWGLMLDGKLLEYTCTIDPRSTHALNNGPGGNIGQLSWKTGDKLLSGIELEVQIFKSQFEYPRMTEYAISGRPIEWDTSVQIHNALDAKWDVRFFLLSMDLYLGPCFGWLNCLFASPWLLQWTVCAERRTTNGPTNTMFLSGKRPVFVSNNASLDLLKDSDLRYNCVPECLVRTDKSYVPISFHELGLLGKGVVINLTLTPLAWVKNLKGVREQHRPNCRTCQFVYSRFGSSSSAIDLSDSEEESGEPASKKTKTGGTGGNETVVE